MAGNNISASQVANVGLKTIKELIDSLTEDVNVFNTLNNEKCKMKSRGTSLGDKVKSANDVHDHVDSVWVVAPNLTQSQMFMEQEAIADELDTAGASYAMINMDGTDPVTGEAKTYCFFITDKETSELSREICEKTNQKAENLRKPSYVSYEKFIEQAKEAGINSFVEITNVDDHTVDEIKRTADYPVTSLKKDRDKNTVVVFERNSDRAISFIIKEAIYYSGDVGDFVNRRDEEKKKNVEDILGKIQNNDHGYTVIDAKNPGYELVADSEGFHIKVNGHEAESRARNDSNAQQFAYNFISMFQEPVCLENDKDLERKKEQAYRETKEKKVSKETVVMCEKRLLCRAIADMMQQYDIGTGLEQDPASMELYRKRILDERDKIENTQERVKREMDSEKIRGGVNSEAYKRLAATMTTLETMHDIVESSMSEAGISDRSRTERSDAVYDISGEGKDVPSISLEITDCVLGAYYLEDDDMEKVEEMYREDNDIVKCGFLMRENPKITQTVIEEITESREEVAESDLSQDTITHEDFEQEVQRNEEETLDNGLTDMDISM